MVHLLRMKHLHILFGILLHKRFLYSPFIYVLIYLSNYLFLTVDSWIFILNFSYNPILFCFSNCYSFAIGSSFSWHLCPFVTPPPPQYYSFFEHFFLFWHYKILQAHLMFPAPVLESIISPRSPVGLLISSLGQDQGSY